MQNRVFFLKSLISNILRNSRLISKLAYRVNKISICLKFSAPKFGFYFRMLFENLLGCDTFQHGDNHCRTQLGNTLNQKMNMILVSANLQKVNLVPFLNFNANIFKRLIYCFAKHNSTIFGRTNKMIQQY